MKPEQQTNWWATGAFLMLVTLIVLAVGPFSAEPSDQAMSTNAKYSPPSGFIPETITIAKTMPDSALVCVEPVVGSLVQCRTVGELRKWMMDRKGK